MLSLSDLYPIMFIDTIIGISSVFSYTSLRKIYLCFDCLYMEYLLHRYPEIPVSEKYTVMYVNMIRKIGCVFGNDKRSILFALSILMMVFYSSYISVKAGLKFPLFVNGECYFKRENPFFAK